MGATKANGPGETQSAIIAGKGVETPAIPSQPTGSPTASPAASPAVSPAGTTAAPARPADLEPHFDTPTWVRPDSTPRPSVLTQVPVQAAPVHEQVVRPADVPAKGRWVARHRIRTLLGLVLVLLVAGSAAAAWYAVTRSRQDLFPYFGIPAVLVVGLWAIMVNSTPTKVELDGSTLTVRHHGRRDVFDLSDSSTSMSVVPAGERPWQVQLECADGSTVTLTDRQFKPEVLGPIFEHFARISRASMVARLERYRR